jgi:hypothetical protein
MICCESLLRSELTPQYPLFQLQFETEDPGGLGTPPAVEPDGLSVTAAQPKLTALLMAKWRTPKNSRWIADVARPLTFAHQRLSWLLGHVQKPEKRIVTSVIQP